MKVKMFSFLDLTMHFLLLQSPRYPSGPQTLFKSSDNLSVDLCLRIKPDLRFGAPIYMPFKTLTFTL